MIKCLNARQQEVQFHVDNLSSAHIYLRLREGDSWEDIPKELLEDCAQLTKANSIEGLRIQCFPQNSISHMFRQ
jgi:hypothetical protein